MEPADCRGCWFHYCFFEENTHYYNKNNLKKEKTSWKYNYRNLLTR